MGLRRAGREALDPLARPHGVRTFAHADVISFEKSLPTITCSWILCISAITGYWRVHLA
jgi:hypothetical protein